MNPFQVLLYVGMICTTDARTMCGVKYLYNYDGDTAKFDLVGQGHPIFSANMDVRLHGIDAPEIDGKGPCEAKRAVEARDFARDIMMKAKRIDLQLLAKDKYFRLLADVVADGYSVAQKMVDAKLAIGYDGGTKLKVDWCKSPPVVGKTDVPPSPLPEPTPAMRQL